ncbi:hypothetical protein J6590_060479 [Homalodisca vitripennis]|nr:hypothetical protein J6590_060479 [Homalodisca vitripennis]
MTECGSGTKANGGQEHNAAAVLNIPATPLLLWLINQIPTRVTKCSKVPLSAACFPPKHGFRIPSTPTYRVLEEAAGGGREVTFTASAPVPSSVGLHTCASTDTCPLSVQAGAHGNHVLGNAGLVKSDRESLKHHQNSVHNIKSSLSTIQNFSYQQSKSPLPTIQMSPYQQSRRSLTNNLDVPILTIQICLHTNNPEVPSLTIQTFPYQQSKSPLPTIQMSPYQQSRRSLTNNPDVLSLTIQTFPYQQSKSPLPTIQMSPYQQSKFSLTNNPDVPLPTI